MAQTKVTSELLRQFAKLLQEECGRFRQIKSSMDEKLNSFLWDDPVAHKFKAQYEDGLKPLNEKLYPAMEKYENYLLEQVKLVDEGYAVDEKSSGFGKFATMGGAAAVAGVASGAAIGASGEKRRVVDRPANTSSSKKESANPQMSNVVDDKKEDEVKNDESATEINIKVDKDGSLSVKISKGQQAEANKPTEVIKDEPRKVVPRNFNKNATK